MCNYEIINLDDYIQSGEGGQSLTYTRKDGKAMAKLFLKSYGGFPRDECRYPSLD